MRLIVKILLLTFLFTFNTSHLSAQNEMFKQKKERKRLWRRWKKNREAYNPYVDAKAKNKPSARMARGDKKELKRQKRMARKQMRYSKKRLN